ncbi:MarR family winged helix-turn-helix transcriptional regulator [Psychrobacillus sp. L4]|uniref:MarR family winged helix-turn-helix transcriptional regulator n=1 Tax=Psychrobacillus sp. L4 TaxID=3236892 RepID=UPI0036F28F96
MDIKNDITIDMLLDIYYEVSKKMSSQRAKALAEHLRKIDLTLNQYLILSIIEHDGASLSIYLAEKLRLKAASITYLVDSLEKRGLVKRVDNPEDRRSHYINLTDEGIKVMSFPMKDTVITQFFKKMDQDELEMFYFMLRLLNRKIT